MHKLMRYIKGYEKQALLAPLFKMLEACFELFVPLVIASIIDTGIKNEDAAFSGSPQRRRWALARHCARTCSAILAR